MVDIVFARLLCVVVKVAELWDRLTWLRGRSLSLLRTTSWTLTQVGLEVSKVRGTFRKRRQLIPHVRFQVPFLGPESQLKSGFACAGLLCSNSICLLLN